MTIVLNLGAGQFVAWLNKLGPRAGLNAAFILHNRGEFALILATLSLSAGLDDRIQPFAGLYVLIMAIVGPILASRSESIGQFLSERRRRPSRATAKRGALEEEEFALVEAAMADTPEATRTGPTRTEPARSDPESVDAPPRRESEHDELDDEFPDPMRQALIDQAMQQSDGAEDRRPRRPVEPDY